ncbi:MAG: VWA domain-containing protein [Limisphaerales bacterium]
MPFQFTHPWWLPLLALALVWVVRLAIRSDSSLVGWRRWTVLGVRVAVTLALGLALAGFQYRMPVEGMNVFFVLDRSDSIPAGQQEAAREFVNTASATKNQVDRGGVVVFGADAAIESAVNSAVDLQRVQAVISSAGSDLAGAIRLATAAFPETGQRRIVLFSDGNQTTGDALQAVVASRALGVSVDVVPLGAQRGGDVVLQKVVVPTKLKQGQTFEVKIFVESDRRTRANLSLYRNEQFLGSQPVDLEPGKNLFSFPQTLTSPDFYSYDVRLDAVDDAVAENNRSTSYTTVRGEPRILIVSSDVAADQPLAEALRASNLEVRLGDLAAFPATLPEMQSHDAIFLSNIAAGDLSTDLMRLLESAVRDFGVGLVVVGGDQAFGAGGYRGTPLEEALPVDMELSSKKVLPRGALVLVVHATEFPNGNQWARDIAFAALQALGPQDEMGIVLWDGSDRWLFPLTAVGDKREKGRAISGMNPGDMPAFGNVMSMAHDALKASTANLKHMVVFSDGDPGEPSDALMAEIIGNRITVSTVMIGGHVEPSAMISIAEKGKGRFYDVRSPAQLPQIFVKEAAVILKAAIIEDPFRPQVGGGSEIIRGIASADYPLLKGYVATTAKARAEIPLVSDKGDPILGQWQFGLGRSVAFTSDARAKWASEWLAWGQYRQFWSQLAQWALKKVDATDLTSEVTIENGEGRLSVEALDAEGNFRNFLNLQAIVVDPKGQPKTVRLRQEGPGRYEAIFPARDIGAYMVNLMDMADGQVRGVQTLGANVNYSPEFNLSEPNHGLLRRFAESGGGRVLNPAVPTDNPFLHDRVRTFRPLDLWWWLLMAAVALFPIDVGLRRVQLEREEISRAWSALSQRIGWRRTARPMASKESMANLLARKQQVKSTHAGPSAEAPADLFKPVHEVEPGAPAAPATTPKTPPPAPASGPDQPAPAPAASGSTAGRLLEAKRRARKNL